MFEVKFVHSFRRGRQKVVSIVQAVISCLVSYCQSSLNGVCSFVKLSYCMVSRIQMKSSNVS